LGKKRKAVLEQDFKDALAGLRQGVDRVTRLNDEANLRNLIMQRAKFCNLAV
jgi:hypothetical protein